MAPSVHVATGLSSVQVMLQGPHIEALQLWCIVVLGGVPPNVPEK